MLFEGCKFLFLFSDAMNHPHCIVGCKHSDCNMSSPCETTAERSDCGTSLHRATSSLYPLDARIWVFVALTSRRGIVILVPIFTLCSSANLTVFADTGEKNASGSWPSNSWRHEARICAGCCNSSPTSSKQVEEEEKQCYEGGSH